MDAEANAENWRALRARCPEIYAILHEWASAFDAEVVLYMEGKAKQAQPEPALVPPFVRR